MAVSEIMNNEAVWYVVHTYSGYENKVKANLEKTVENRNMQDVIQEIRVPTEDVVEVRGGKKHVSQRKIFPGYVMVKMVMNNQTWYVVRNTRGVTGFVGPESTPIPLSEQEVANMGVGSQQIRHGYEVGDLVLITAGPLESFNGVIESIDNTTQQVSVTVSMFGRDTNVELGFDQIQKL